MACSHFLEYKTRFGLEPFRTVHGYFVAPMLNPNLTSLYHKTAGTLGCFRCEGIEKLMACLHCIFIGCPKDHAREHAVKEKHFIQVDLWSGCIRCALCADYVYDSDFEEIACNHTQAKVHEDDPVVYSKWMPNPQDVKVLRQHRRRVTLDCNSRIGMRGIINLGSTCFMNCIMQALLHTPMLRDYFFSDQHKCQLASKSDCLVCHFSRLYQDYYTSSASPMSLHEILYFVWQNAHHLSGYEQKDAHEFFIAALNLLHQYSSPRTDGKEQCTCIIDIVFHGKMQSDLVCQRCDLKLSSRNVSTTVDPIWDISLDIPDPPAEANLYECLKHFTRTEALGASAKIKCNSCRNYEESTKQLTFRTLPIVIVIHLKRFEHDASRHKKKTLFVEFPSDLDMSPFMSGWRNRNTQKIENILDYRYSLYAVIVHTGTLDTGHYLAYIRQTKCGWFKCSDVCVQPADIKEVMASEGYLLFYHKTILTYQ